MSILGANLSIGRAALATYQSALAISGQNIANVGNPDYARQSGRLSALDGGLTLSGVAPGSGVALDRLVRHFDGAVEGRLRQALSNRSGAETTQRTLAQLESLYNELTDADLSSGLSAFFGHFSTLQLNPQDSATRGLILSSAESLSGEFRRVRSGLVEQVRDLNVGAEQAVARADEIAREIADLNVAIMDGDARASGGGNALRDRRDGLLRELAEYLDIHVREQANGSVSVYVNSDPLVQEGRSRGLHVQKELQDGLEIFQVRFNDDNGLVRFRDGQLAGVVLTRDRQVRAQISKLDQLAAAMIYEVNRVHSTGVGLEGYESLTGGLAVQDANAALTSPAAGLRFPVQNGVMIVHVRNQASGQEITRQIEIDLDGIGGNDTTLQSLADDLGAVPGLTSVVTADGRLQIVADNGSEVWFSEDTSGALAALGVGAFFDGQDAATIEVRAEVQGNQNLIAAARSGAPGDGDNAARLALLMEASSSLLGGKSIQQSHSDLYSAVAVATASAQTRFDAADAVYSSLLAQREAISGVSLDEEAINLTKFQTAFAGAARYVGVVQQMSDVILSLAR